MPHSSITDFTVSYASLKVNYLTIPVYICGFLSLIVQCYFSDKMQQRAVFLVGSALPVVAGYLSCVGTPNPTAGYIAMFILSFGMQSNYPLLDSGSVLTEVIPLGVYSISTLVVTWVATNLMPDQKRSVALPVFYSIGNLSGLVSSQLYPSQHAPRYVIGNSISAGLECVAVCFFVSGWFLLRMRNKRKEKLVADGATTNGLEGDMALGFKYGL